MLCTGPLWLVMTLQQGKYLLDLKPNIMKTEDNLNLVPLTDEELVNNEGGFIAIAIGASLLLITCAYYAGYAYGTLTRE